MPEPSFEVRAAPGAQVVGTAWRTVQDRLALSSLLVEQPQWVAVESPSALFAQPVAMLAEIVR